jgi:hypothetical protein
MVGARESGPGHRDYSEATRSGTVNFKLRHRRRGAAPAAKPRLSERHVNCRFQKNSMRSCSRASRRIRRTGRRPRANWRAGSKRCLSGASGPRSSRGRGGKRISLCLLDSGRTPRAESVITRRSYVIGFSPLLGRNSVETDRSRSRLQMPCASERSPSRSGEARDEVSLVLARQDRHGCGAGRGDRRSFDADAPVLVDPAGIQSRQIGDRASSRLPSRRRRGEPFRSHRGQTRSHPSIRRRQSRWRAGSCP